jgi:hypothetical protein
MPRLGLDAMLAKVVWLQVRYAWVMRLPETNKPVNTNITLPPL